MNAPELLDALLGTTGSFESALSHVRDADGRDLLIGLINRLDTGHVLENAECERRLIATYARLSLNRSDLISIAEAGSKITNGVLRNAITQLLPPEYRGLVFRAKEVVEPEPPHRGNVVSAAFTVSVDVAAHAANSAEPHTPFSDVILLSITDSPATAKLLDDAGFVPLRCQSLDEVDNMLSRNVNICALLVHSSFLKLLNPDQQTKLIEKLAAFSTFAWLRFEEDGLADQPVDIGHLIANVRCRSSPPDLRELSFQHGAVRQTEISILKSAAKRLTEGKADGLFTPGELNPLELKLLGAAMSEYSKKRHFNPRAELTKVTTSFLQGGQTGARVALVKVDDVRMPVVVKIDQKDLILDEAHRFANFIQRDNPELSPEIHLHAAAALIVFGIISDPHSETEQPAPTLEQELTRFWYDEMREPQRSDSGSILLNGFSDAAKRLARLNKQKCAENRFPCKANPYLDVLIKMEKQGFDWGFDRRAIAVRSQSQELLAPLARLAICHGDAHTRNVLIRNDQAFLIDYALSGPGHPCSDLVKLELSVYLTKFVPFGSESELANLQRDISIARLPVTELLSRHRGLLRSKANELSLRMCVAARDMAVEVLQSHKLSWEHYTATKILTAWQSLQIPALQQSLARGIISAISE